jgi:hypothetical protein
MLGVCRCQMGATVSLRRTPNEHVNACVRACARARVCALQSDELFTTEASTEDLQKLRKELEESRYCEGCFVLGRLCQGQRDSSVGSRVLARGV